MLRRLFLIFFILTISFFPPSSVSAITKIASTSISATIGQRYFTLDGYTSPKSVVQLETNNLNLTTHSNNFGYFQFNRSPISPQTSEVCLYSIDHHNRPSTPTCIPAPPPGNYYTHIGPTLLPPTLTLNSSKVDPHSTSLASGQSIPDSPVNIYLYQANDQAKSFPKPAQAYSLPIFTAQSDELGNFNFNLPTAQASNFRLFAVTQYQDHPSPKSNTLTYLMPSLFNYLYIFIPLFIITLIIFLYLLFLPRKPRRYLPVPLALPSGLSPSGRKTATWSIIYL